MNAIRRTAPLLVVGALLVGGHALASCGGSGESSATTSDVYATDSETQTTQTETTIPLEQPTEVRVVVENGAPEGGIVRETVEKDDRVVLVVESDVSDEVHLHGYDISRGVAAGGTARVAFRATIPGRFEVELEERGVQIAELTVGP